MYVCMYMCVCVCIIMYIFIYNVCKILSFSYQDDELPCLNIKVQIDIYSRYTYHSCYYITTNCQLLDGLKYLLRL